jgi:hypothetical protein
MAMRQRPVLTSAQLRKKYARVVAVPKTPPSAYNPDRPISGLLANQIRHLHIVEQGMSPGRQSGIDVTAIETEREASRYIQHLMRTLHPQGAPRPGKRAAKAARVRRVPKPARGTRRRTPAAKGRGVKPRRATRRGTRGTRPHRRSQKAPLRKRKR